MNSPRSPTSLKATSLRRTIRQPDSSTSLTITCVSCTSPLSDRFCELTRQYVSELGGGLVGIAGPRFGPRELYQTPLADMLPVIIDPAAEMRSAPDQPEFRPRQTPHARRYPFMQLGADEAE